MNSKPTAAGCSSRASPAAARRILERGGLLDVLGEDGIVGATDRIFGALDDAVKRGREWIVGRT